MLFPTRSAATSYRVLVAAILAALTVPRMTQAGMFIDGVVYAIIARNFSVGLGSFWTPSYTRTINPEFFEHPPLGFAIEGAAFWLFGDHLAVERLFSLLVFGLHAFVIALIWRRVLAATLDWLPVLFWIVPSIVTWAAINNMLENMQALFTSTAVWLLIAAPREAKLNATVIRAVLAGVAIVAAALVKGPVGLFPLAVPALLWILPAERRPRQTVLLTMVLAATVVLLAVALGVYEPSRHALTEYLRTQLWPSIQGERVGLAGPAGIVRHLVFGILVRLVLLAALIRLVARRRELSSDDVRLAGFFFVIALSASLPVGVSQRLSGHYLLPSVPFFALGFAALSRGAVTMPEFVDGWKRWAPQALAALLAVATLLVPLVHGSLERRDVPLLRDLALIGPSLPVQPVIGTCAAATWSVHAYVHRFHRLSLDAWDRPVDGWLLQTDGACPVPPTCQSAASSETLTLFRCAS